MLITFLFYCFLYFILPSILYTSYVVVYFSSSWLFPLFFRDYFFFVPSYIIFFSTLYFSFVIYAFYFSFLLFLNLFFFSFHLIHYSFPISILLPFHYILLFNPFLLFFLLLFSTVFPLSFFLSFFLSYSSWIFVSISSF